MLKYFGESHGTGVGAVCDFIPAGFEPDLDALKAFMKRRQGGSALTTARREEDEIEFLSGITNGRTNGSPLCVFIKNNNVRRSDYPEKLRVPRPGHADYTAYMKWQGNSDLSGGGHLSGRLTAAMCALGGIAIQFLASKSIYAGAHLYEAAGIRDDAFPLLPEKALFDEVSNKPLPCISDAAAVLISDKLAKIKAAGDSAGGIVECCVTGIDPGLGDPIENGLESRLAAALFAIPAVKGVEFGSGFEGSRLLGSRNNDAFYSENGLVRTRTNNAGGILGGISNGMPLVMRAAFKPTPSISVSQESIDLDSLAPEAISTSGRHDPCVAIRAVPAVEAVAALTLLGIIEKN